VPRPRGWWLLDSGLRDEAHQNRAVPQNRVDRGDVLARVEKQLAEPAIAVSAVADGKLEAAMLDLGDIMPASIREALAAHGALRRSKNSGMSKPSPEGAAAAAGMAGSHEIRCPVQGPR
jgi:hypothetical protein